MHRLTVVSCVYTTASLFLPSHEHASLKYPGLAAGGVGDGGRGQDFKGPGAAKNSMRGYKPGLGGKEHFSGFQTEYPRFSLPEGKAEGTPVASLVNVPAFDVSLAHEISLQFGDHDADDPDEDKKVDLQNT